MTISFADNNKDKTVLIFSGAPGDPVFRKLNKWYNVVSVNEKRTWFHDTDFKSLSKWDYKFAIGTSMGGHAALHYASLFDIPRVIAFSPQYSVNPKSVECKWNSGGRKLKYSSHRMGVGLNPNVKYNIFFTDCSDDSTQIPMFIKNDFPITMLEDYHIHNIPGEMKKQGTLYSFIHDLLEE